MPVPQKEVLIVDNYDSFTHNLAALAASASNAPIRVVRAKEGLARIREPWKAVIFGPGPSAPDAHPELLACLERLPNSTPALGVCLGMQAFAQVHGGSLALLERPRHGKLRTMQDVLPSRTIHWPPCPFPIGSYHSWIVDEVPKGWKAIGTDSEGVLMAMEHQVQPWLGLQFHPESVMTPDGLDMMRGFFKLGKHG